LGCTEGKGKAAKIGHGPATVIGRRCWFARTPTGPCTKSELLSGWAGKGRSWLGKREDA